MSLTTLTVTKAGTGGGTVTSNDPVPLEISCGIDCVQVYGGVTVVTLTATPDPGSVFTGWSGDPDCSDGSVTMDASKTCTANFHLLSSDLSITKTDGPDPVTVGQDLTYTIIATNNGPDEATGVVVADALDPSLSYVWSSTTKGLCSFSTGVVTCNIGSLSNGESATIIIVVNPNSSGIVNNTAIVSCDASDPDGSNNTASVSTTVDPLFTDADLSITKTDTGFDPVEVGLNITYIITVTNNGPATATGVTVTETLDSNLNFVSVTPSQGTCGAPAGSVVICSLGSLADGAFATITVVAETTTAGVVGNTASVSANENDPNNGNDSVTETTNVGDVSRLLNISTRSFVGVGEDVQIAGIFVGGNVVKRLIFRARGGSMSDPPFNITGVLGDPHLRLFDSLGNEIARNDNWGTTPDPLSTCSTSGYVCGNVAEIIATGLDPCQPNPGQVGEPTGCGFEAMIVIDLPPGGYSAVVSGVGMTTGVGLVEVFDTDGTTLPKLINISTRAQVLNGFNVMIGGFWIGAGAGELTIGIRVRGGSLGGEPFNIPGVLPDPVVRLYSFNEDDYIAENDNYEVDDPLCAISGYVCGGELALTAAGLNPCDPNPGQIIEPPGCANEAGFVITLPPGGYSAVASGVGEATGVGLVEIFELSP